MRPRLKRQRASSEQQRSKVGFPIRKFTDQSLFAAPHDLSQRTTSFIASQRQGIHRIPLRHLIALIAKTRSRASDHGGQTSEDRHTIRPLSPSSVVRFLGVEKTSFASNASGDLGGQAPDPRLVAYQTTENRDRGQLNLSSDFRRPASDNRMRFLFTMSDIGGRTTDDGGQISSPSAFRPPNAARQRRSTKLIKLASEGGFDPTGSDPEDKAHPTSVVRSPSSEKWSQTGSNRRPHACKARALPTELWPPEQ